MTQADRPWWQTTTIYQIYPRSFQDSNGDGVGDLRGIIARIPYLKELGIETVWISPFFPSPMKDFGYDISDYCGIDPLFGLMADFDALLAELHANGLRLILDLVPNHTSDQHSWFGESRLSRSSPRRDWYIWRDPDGDGGPPNNWLSEFGGSAWTYDPATSQYYHHAFLGSQPDLNWRNPDVRAAMHDVMRFWLRKGVDGFRVDVMWHLMKDAQFRDNPLNPAYDASRPPYESLLTRYSADVDEVHDVVRGLREVVDEFDDRLLIGEIYLPLERVVAYYGNNLGGAHLPFNFALLTTPWTAADIAAFVKRYEALLPAGAWPNWVLGNHDRRRLASRVGKAQLRNAAMLLLTLRGTPTLYYGDEIGMMHADIPPDRIRDPWEINVPGKGIGRDGVRTPMQWSSDNNAGFSSTEPWLPLGENWEAQNVEAQAGDSASLMNFYRRLIALRKKTPALQLGVYDGIGSENGALWFAREYGAERLWVALNLTGNPALLETAPERGEIVISTFADRDQEVVGRSIELRPNEGVIVRETAA
ncbi:MAG: alpha-amylase [Proteobacteria bacterium SG_bin9]|nr:MAG: alpha-amylase [Proteobacteria bacterium SG_bin9]